MLTAEEKREIETQAQQYTQKRAACIEALKIVQERRHWISDENIHDIAELLDMTPDELDNVATFYNLIYRKPVGRHVIHVCDSISCWIMGYERLRQRLVEQLGVNLGETTEDNRFTLLPIVCLGTCDHAPALMIDSDLHYDINPDGVDEILARYK